MFKPKNKPKRKNSDKIRWWLAGGAALLTLVVVAAVALVAVQTNRPPAPLASATTAVPVAITQPALLCDTDVAPYGFITHATNNMTTWLYREIDTSYTSGLTSPDGRYSVRETRDGLFLRAHATGAIMPLIQRVKDEHIGDGLAFSPDSRYLAFVNNTTLNLHDTTTGQQHQIEGVHVPTSIDLSQHNLSWSPDSTRLIFIEVGLVSLIDVPTGSVIRLEIATQLTSAVVYWSEGGHYFVLDHQLHETQTGKLMQALPDYVYSPVFSPDEQFIAYLDREQNLVVQSVTNPQQMARTIVSGTAGFHALVWSPNSRYIILSQIYEGGMAEELQVFSAPEELSENGRIPALNRITTQYNYMLNVPAPFEPLAYALTPAQQQAFYWSEDGETLYLRQISEPNSAELSLWTLPMQNMAGASLHRLPIDRRIMTQIMRGEPVLAFAEPEGGRKIEAYQNKDDYAVFDTAIVSNASAFIAPDQTNFVVRGTNGTGSLAELFNLTSGTTTTLVERATQMGNPSWSPDGSRVALTYAEGIGAMRRVGLVIATQDGSELITLTDDYRSVYDVVWSADGQQVAYTVWREDGTHIELADTHTGARVRLVTDALTTDRLVYDRWTGEFTAWWQDQNELMVWHGGFTTDGEPTFLLQGRYPYRQFDGFGRHPTRGQVTNTLQTGEVFWSPDGMAAVLRFGVPGYRQQIIQLAYPDGRIPLMLDDRVDGYITPQWSPDSEFVLHGLQYQSTTQLYTISRRDGQFNAQLSHFSGYYWVGCPDMPQQ